MKRVITLALASALAAGATAFAAVSTGPAAAAARVRALSDTDTLLGRVVAAAGPDTFVLVAGMDPLTRWNLPETHAITPAKTAEDMLPELPVVWTANLPDRRSVKVPLRTPVADSPPPGGRTAFDRGQHDRAYPVLSHLRVTRIEFGGGG